MCMLYFQCDGKLLKLWKISFDLANINRASTINKTAIFVLHALSKGLKSDYLECWLGFHSIFFLVLGYLGLTLILLSIPDRKVFIPILWSNVDKHIIAKRFLTNDDRCYLHFKNNLWRLKQGFFFFFKLDIASKERILVMTEFWNHLKLFQLLGSNKNLDWGVGGYMFGSDWAGGTSCHGSSEHTKV